MHLTIIAYAAKLNWEIERAIFRVNGFDSRRRTFVRCQDVAELPWVVREVMNRADARISRLDIFGHGSAGYLSLGTPGQDVVSNDEASWSHIFELDELLDDTAEVRLLGCDTATDAQGRRVLQGLEAGLSNGTKKRTVWGSTASLVYLDFGPEGFRPEVARQFLVSGAMVTNPLVSIHRIVTSDPFQPSGFLPRGYVPSGLGDLADEVGDEQFSVGDFDVLAFSSRRVVGLRHSGGPLSLFRWAGVTQAPTCEQLKTNLNNR